MNPLTGRWQVLTGVALLHAFLLVGVTTRPSASEPEPRVITTLQARVLAAEPQPVARPTTQDTVANHSTPVAVASRTSVRPVRPASPVAVPRPSTMSSPEPVSSPTRQRSPSVPTTPSSAPSSPAPTASPSQAPVNVPTPIIAARYDADYLRNPAPPYPTFARRRHEEGRVLLRVTVSPDGSPARVQLQTSSGHESLDSAALTTVATWRFIPARQGDTAITSEVVVPITFALR